VRRQLLSSARKMTTYWICALVGLGDLLAGQTPPASSHRTASDPPELLSALLADSRPYPTCEGLVFGRVFVFRCRAGLAHMSISARRYRGQSTSWFGRQVPLRHGDDLVAAGRRDRGGLVGTARCRSPRPRRCWRQVVGVMSGAKRHRVSDTTEEHP
jgi:hypothetical protein